MLAVGIVVIAACIVIVALGWLLSREATKIAADLPNYRLTLSKKIESLRGGISDSSVLKRASDVLEDLEEELDRPLSDTEPDRVEVGKSPDRPEQEPMLVEIREAELKGLALFRSFVGPLLSPLVSAGIVLLFVVFILLRREDLRDRLIRLFGDSDLQRATSAMSDAASRLSSYFLSLVVISAFYGVFIALALWAMGMPAPIVWGILAMLMRFVPYVGSFIAAVPPTVIAAAIDPGWVMPLMVMGLFVVGELTMGQLVEPYVFGRGTGVTPVAVVGSTIFWAWLWGPIGLLIATPVTVCLLVLGRHVEGLSFLEVLLGDQPALTPEQRFYQRALIGDAADITFQAELALKEQGLESYFGAAALGALKLAERDAANGMLDEEQAVRIDKTVKEMLINLADVEPHDWFMGLLKRDAKEDLEDSSVPAAEETPTVRVVDRASLAQGWDVETPVLCIGGRSVLDDAAAAILSLTLRQRKLDAEVLAHEVLSADRIAALSDTKAKLVCLSYLGPGTAPIEVRYLVRRLRRILPKKTCILVACWANADEEPEAASVLKTTGADAYAFTLHEAVELCVDAAYGH